MKTMVVLVMLLGIVGICEAPELPAGYMEFKDIISYYTCVDADCSELLGIVNNYYEWRI